jgi:hypothetical protein
VLRFLWGKDLGFIEIPEVHKVHGEEAVKVLQNLIAGLEHDKDSKLTKRQKRTLIKIASSLIDSIKEERQNKKGKKAVQTFSEQDPFALFKRILPWIPH